MRIPNLTQPKQYQYNRPIAKQGRPGIEIRQQIHQQKEHSKADQE
jgi:hypothetical protein